ncbi:MAG: hypothetical protein QXX19_07225 [Candidatus Caldarchaeum sp.]
MDQNKAISAQAEIRTLDISKVPPIFRCPKCGDLLRALMHISYEGSPIFYCEICSAWGKERIYYYLAPKGLIV